MRAVVPKRTEDTSAARPLSCLSVALWVAATAVIGQFQLIHTLCGCPTPKAVDRGINTCTVAATAATLPFGSTRLALAQPAPAIGTDTTGLNLCLYGDCEARGTYVADPYGWPNPATMPVATLPYVTRGGFFSGSYFRLNVGSIGADVGSATVTVAATPLVLQVNTLYAESTGSVRSLPGVDLQSRTRVVRLAAAVDLDRAMNLRGFSIGLIGAVPATESDSRLSQSGFTFLTAKEQRDIDLTLGLHWRGGTRDWFMSGALLNALRDHVTSEGVDLATGAPLRQTGTTNAWFARAGVSLLPLVPAGLAEGASPAAELAGELRMAVDMEHKNIAVPSEGSRKDYTAYFGLDARIAPDAWNPAAHYMRLYGITGVDTGGGWGLGLGIYGNGPLQLASCNPAYSSRPLAPSLGHRVNIWSATCSIALPL
jgi:hypothetical protein